MRTAADFQNTDGVQDIIAIALAEVGTSVVITVDASTTIEIQNKTMSQLHASDFLFV
jgi:uncharacterized RmlC-like cupin family protein